MRLSLRGIGMGLGVIGILIFVGIAVLAKYSGIGDGALEGLQSLYPGMESTWKGIGLSALWGFAQGFVIGIIFGFLYNIFS